MRRMRFVPINAINMGMNINMQQPQMTIYKSPSLPQKKPISMNKPMSLMPNGKECIQFPYGTSVITTINGMQGTTIPSNMIYNNGCFQN
jgi:hypothetical protein